MPPIDSSDIKKDALHKELGVPTDKKIPDAELQAAKNSSDPKERKRATFALNAKKWNHESVTRFVDSLAEGGLSARELDMQSGDITTSMYGGSASEWAAMPMTTPCDRPTCDHPKGNHKTMNLHPCSRCSCPAYI